MNRPSPSVLPSPANSQETPRSGPTGQRAEGPGPPSTPPGFSDPTEEGLRKRSRFLSPRGAHCSLLTQHRYSCHFNLIKEGKHIILHEIMFLNELIIGLPFSPQRSGKHRVGSQGGRLRDRRLVFAAPRLGEHRPRLSRREGTLWTGLAFTAGDVPGRRRGRESAVTNPKVTMAPSCPWTPPVLRF